MRSRRTGTCRSAAVPREVMRRSPARSCSMVVLVPVLVLGACWWWSLVLPVPRSWTLAVRSPAARRDAARDGGSRPGMRSGWRPGPRGRSQQSGDHLLRLVGEALLGALEVGVPGGGVPDLDAGAGAD